MSELAITKKVESCNIAIDNARYFGKILDFSKKSIMDIEEILVYFWKDLHKGFIKSIIQKIKGEKPSESQIFQWLQFWGRMLVK